MDVKREHVVKSLDDTEATLRQEELTMDKKVIFVVYTLLIALGVGTGYVLSSQRHASGLNGAQTTQVIQTDTVAGVSDTTTFKDSAEGTVETGGASGEGSHKLIREGGPSQTAYLVSSVVDLDQYVGKKVRVWGQTMAAKKVSWLMDVGKIEVLTE